MDLTDIEQALFERLPRPPQNGRIKKPTIIWIVEWLSPCDQRTGDQLHKWMQEHCPFRSKHYVCKSKKEVITTIERATHFADSETIPLLHIEGHGDEDGLQGPHGSGSPESLTWDELTVPLQQLNRHTQCNLVVFVASCTGFAGIQVFSKGPLAPKGYLAPAVALVGPLAPIVPSDLLNGTKEFYRRLRDNQSNLNEMVNSASLESGEIAFELQPFVFLAFEAFAEMLIILNRPEKQWLELDRNFSPPLEERKQFYQSFWDKLFMIDLFPDNQQRFGIDWSVVIDMVERGG